MNTQISETGRAAGGSGSLRVQQSRFMNANTFTRKHAKIRCESFWKLSSSPLIRHTLLHYRLH